MRHIFIIFTLLILLVSNSNCQTNQTKIKVIAGRITKYSVDSAYIGMKINDLTKTYSSCAFSKVPLYKFGIDSEDSGLLIEKSNRQIMFVWTMQGDSLIAGIFCLTDEFETGNKIKVGLSVKDLLIIYPECSLRRDCLAMESEYSFLADIGVTIEFVTNDKNSVGKYLQDDCNEETTMLDINRKIDRIVIEKKE